jgi:hypothetical protein
MPSPQTKAREALDQAFEDWYETERATWGMYHGDQPPSREKVLHWRTYRAVQTATYYLEISAHEPPVDDTWFKNWLVYLREAVDAMLEHLDHQPPERTTPESPLCEHCGRPLSAVRSDARYCSDTCRQRAYRARVRGEQQ